MEISGVSQSAEENPDEIFLGYSELEDRIRNNLSED
jgi:hypothetical protein